VKDCWRTPRSSASSCRSRPSDRDLAAMHALVNDAATGATFAILMILRLDNVELQIGTYLFVPADPAVYVIPLVLDTDPAQDVGLKEHAVGPPTFRLPGKAGAAIRLVSNPDVADRTCGRLVLPPLN
jgi:hypothetical protein